MAQYRFLQDHSINNAIYQAGTIATLPNGWIPTANVDPLDAAAVNAFWAAGPQVCGSIKTQWSGLPVAAPVTRWIEQVPPGPFRAYVLTGLGAGLPFKG